MSSSQQLRALENAYGARNYDPLPVTLAHGEGVWLYDTEGKRYFDALSAYSALNFGHRHPRLVAAATEQLGRLTLTGRAFGNDQLGPLCEELAQFCGKDRVLPMNTGAEGVETAIKVARKWGYERKGVARDRAKIIVCENNFHGRTTTIVSFSSDPVAREGFGPYTPGFTSIPYGDAEALRAAIDAETVAFLVEPVQGEAGVIVPPAGYFETVKAVCEEAGVLLIADEIQTAFGRTGRRFACDHDGVEPDVYVLGKALGGGVLPLSAVVANDEVLGVLRPGQHGSTFGGNPLACAVGREVLRLVEDGSLASEAAKLGEAAARQLSSCDLPGVTAIRQIGLWLAIDVEPRIATARTICERLMKRGVLCKETRQITLRIAPPVVTTSDELDWAMERIVSVLADLRG